MMDRLGVTKVNCEDLWGFTDITLSPSRIPNHNDGQVGSYQS